MLVGKEARRDVSGEGGKERSVAPSVHIKTDYMTISTCCVHVPLPLTLHCGCQLGESLCLYDTNTNTPPPSLLLTSLSQVSLSRGHTITHTHHHTHTPSHTHTHHNNKHNDISNNFVRHHISRARFKRYPLAQVHHWVSWC